MHFTELSRFIEQQETSRSYFILITLLIHHGTNVRQIDTKSRSLPLVRFFIVAFHLIRRSHAVETADGEDHIVDDFDGEVAARIVHVGDVTPAVCGRLIFLSAAHPRYPVKTSFNVIKDHLLFTMRRVIIDKKVRYSSDSLVIISNRRASIPYIFACAIYTEAVVNEKQRPI